MLDAITSMGKPVDTIAGNKLNYLEIMETFAHANGLMGQAALAQVR